MSVKTFCVDNSEYVITNEVLNAFADVLTETKKEVDWVEVSGGTIKYSIQSSENTKIKRDVKPMLDNGKFGRLIIKSDCELISYES
jgi:hypothetical protein